MQFNAYRNKLLILTKKRIMESVQIQQIDILELKALFTEIVRAEVQNLISKEPTNKKTDTFGTRKEVAKELRVSLPILREYTIKGYIKSYQIGGRILYKWDEILADVKEIKDLKYSRKNLQI